MITLKLESSSVHSGFDLKRDGVPVALEDALREGFVITEADANVFLTLASRFLENRDANHN